MTKAVAVIKDEMRERERDPLRTGHCHATHWLDRHAGLCSLPTVQGRAVRRVTGVAPVAAQRTGPGPRRVAPRRRQQGRSVRTRRSGGPRLGLGLGLGLGLAYPNPKPNANLSPNPNPNQAEDLGREIEQRDEAHEPQQVVVRMQAGDAWCACVCVCMACACACV